MKNYEIDHKKQFSKRLARWTAIFWFAYLIWLSILMMLEPSVAMYSFYMSIVVSIVMMINVISYSVNSITEKRIFGMLDKAKIELQLGPVKASVGKQEKESKSDSGEDSEDEGGGNG